MTAYATRLLSPFQIEITSFNRRGLDISLNLPPGYSGFIPWIRKAIQRRISRGTIIVRISREGEGQLGGLSQVAMDRAYSELSAHAQRLGYSPPGDLPFSSIISHASSLITPPTCDDEIAMKAGVEGVIEDLLVMKRAEGKELMDQMMRHLQQLREEVMAIEGIAPQEREMTRSRLEMRWKEAEKLLSLSASPDWVKESALLLQKGDITEELTRLHSHLKQTHDRMEGENSPIGKSIEFLIQEMVREANTIASKSSLLETINRVVVIKEELEKLREQVSNVE
ncbi:MAG: DUF1732 domain-containing protein [Chlamydiota bacterium]|nr:DUF1732 domain-containing protein [Chlamydiota bacterium]